MHVVATTWIIRSWNVNPSSDVDITGGFSATDLWFAVTKCHHAGWLSSKALENVDKGAKFEVHSYFICSPAKK